jgi:sRNA-binding protein
MSDPTDLPVPASPDTPPPAASATPGPATADARPDQPATETAATTVSAADAAPADDASAAAPATASGESPEAGEATDAGRTAPLAPAATLALLKQHFPALFNGPARPLKLRIQQDIQARAPGIFTRATLSAFFRRHTTSTAYLIGLSKATHRFDLDGQPAGELAEEHKQAAVVELTRRRQITREREQETQAAQRAAQREAQRAEMAQQAEDMQARQARAALLRDFTRTTLTLANFCALKGMAPEQLNPLLEQAKKEAAESPPVQPRFGDDRRGPGPRRDDRPFGRPDGHPDGRPDRGPRGAQGPDNRGPRRESADGRPPRSGPRDGRRPPGGRGPRGDGGQGGSGPAGTGS